MEKHNKIIWRRSLRRMPHTQILPKSQIMLQNIAKGTTDQGVDYFDQ